MRRLALLALAAAASFAAPAHAQQTCAAAAVPPHFVPSSGLIEASGSFGCATGATAASVEVCIQEQLGGVLGSTWYTSACQTGQAQDGIASATVGIRPPIASGLFRTVATGTTTAGTLYSAKSAPVLWVNCACAP